ncbi:MAG: hypothetical protein WC414_03440 [Patescibacteria group bacterium]
MNDVLKFGKKLFTFSVVALTIAWSMGLATLVPTVVKAEECPALEAGDLYKVPGSNSVYYLNSEMESMYFPTEEVFNSWGFSFSDVKTIPNTCFDMYEQATPAGLNFRPGSRLVKRVESPTVYAVLPGNTRAAIGSEAVAKALYGENWAKLVRDLPGVFMSNFLSTGAALDESVPHNGQFVKETGSDKVYFAMDGKLYEVDGDVTADVRTVSATVLSKLDKSTETVTLASTMEDPAQLGETSGDTTTVVGGDLAVSLSANSPEAATVPINIDNVEFAKVIFKALDEDVVVNSIKIGRRGLGSDSDFASVTLYDENNVKLGNTKTSWTSDGYMNYNISGGWTIPAGKSKTLTITAKLDTAGTYNALGVEDVTTKGSDVNGLPVYGNKMNGVNVTVGQVTITDEGTPATKKIGETDVKLAKFKLAMSPTEDAELYSVTLKNRGTASDGDIANMYLMVGATELAADATMESDYVTFVLEEPYLIEKSKNETFTVYGDIVNGDGNTVEFTLKDTTDLKMIGESYNSQVTVVNTDYNDAGDGSVITMDGAELNISFSSTAIDTMDDQTDVEFGTLTLSAGSTDVNITSLVMSMVEVNGDGSAANNWDIDELEIVDTKTGAAYSGTMTLGDLPDDTSADADAETWTFDDEIYLEAGKTYTFTVRGDVPANVGNGDEYYLTMTVNTTNLQAETQPEGDTVDNFSIGSFTGKKVTVKTPSLKVRSTNLSSIDVVEDQENVVVFEGTMEAVAGDVRVERAIFRATTTNAYFDTDNWSEIGLYVNGTKEQLLTNSQLDEGSIDFDTVDFTVTKGSKVTFKVMGKIASTADDTNKDTKIELYSMTVKDDDNDTVTATNSAGTEIDENNVISTARTVSVRTTGILYVQMRNNDTGFNKDRIVLAGSESTVGKLRIRADYEDIKIEDLVLTNANATSNDSVESVCLLEGTTEVACTTLDGSTATFTDLNKVITKGTHDWTIKVKFNNIGKDYTGDTHDSVAFKVANTGVTARGVDSGDALAYANDGASAGEIVFDLGLNDTFGEAGDTETASSKAFYLSASRLSAVSTVSSYGGETVDTAISAEGQYTAMIISVTAENNTNTDLNGNAVKTLLDAIRLDVAKNASTTFSGATIKRINGAVAAKALTVSDSGATATLVTSSLSTVLGDDAKINAGETAYYVVKVTVNGLSTATNVVNWFQVNMDDLKGAGTGADADNNIDWYDGYNGVSNTVFNGLLLDTETITGTKLSAPKNN